MNILITGGNGYISKSLFKNLNNSISVTRKDFDLTDRDATNKWFEGKYFDVLIHTAVKGGSRLKKDEGDICYQNLQMFYNLCYNKHCFGKFIHFGSGAELNNPSDPYGLSKNIINKLIQSKPNFYNIRIFGVFDENELDTRFIKNNINNYINKKDIIIHQDKLMDFFYMKDLVEVVKYYITETNLSKTTECVYPRKLFLSDVASIINQLSSYKVPIKFLDSRTISPYIGNTPPINIKTIGIEKGIKEVYNKLK